MRSLSLPVNTRDNQTFVFLASPSSQKYIKEISAKTFQLLLSNTEAKKYSYGLVGLKGFLFKQFAIATTKSNIDLLEKVYQQPYYFETIINK